MEFLVSLLRAFLLVQTNSDETDQLQEALFLFHYNKDSGRSTANFNNSFFRQYWSKPALLTLKKGVFQNYLLVNKAIKM